MASRWTAIRASGEAAEAGKLPVGPDFAQQVARRDCVVADIVDFVLGVAVGGLREDHVGGRAAAAGEFGPQVACDRDRQGLTQRHWPVA